MVLSHSGSWDDFWRVHHGRLPISSWSKRRCLRILSTYTGPHANVLDAGCGSGFFSAYFISRGCATYSMDFSDEALSITRKTTRDRANMYIKCDVLDRAELLDLNQRFDVIFTDGLLEHYSKKEQDLIINNLKLLKNDRGYFVNLVPNRNSLWSLVRPFFIHVKERPFKLREFLDLHERNGLKIISSGGLSVLPFRLSPERLLGKRFGMLFYCVSA